MVLSVGLFANNSIYSTTQYVGGTLITYNKLGRCFLWMNEMIQVTNWYIAIGCMICEGTVNTS